MADHHREQLVERFHARYATSDARKHWLHNGIMPDYDTMSTTELEALAAGVRWLTFEPLAAAPVVAGADDGEDFGLLDFGSRAPDQGGASVVQSQVSLQFATQLAEFLGLPPVEDSTGVLCWGDFSPSTEKERAENVCDAINSRLGWAGAHPHFHPYAGYPPRPEYTGGVTLTERAATEVLRWIPTRAPF